MLPSWPPRTSHFRHRIRVRLGSRLSPLNCSFHLGLNPSRLDSTKACSGEGASPLCTSSWCRHAATSDVNAHGFSLPISKRSWSWRVLDSDGSPLTYLSTGDDLSVSSTTIAIKCMLHVAARWRYCFCVGLGLSLSGLTHRVVIGSRCHALALQVGLVGVRFLRLGSPLCVQSSALWYTDPPCVIICDDINTLYTTTAPNGQIT